YTKKVHTDIDYVQNENTTATHLNELNNTKIRRESNEYEDKTIGNNPIVISNVLNYS
ncbi:hypothetical protein KM1_264030, partial [Entamoeba histolytica HM-3:IMSS]